MPTRLFNALISRINSLWGVLLLVPAETWASVKETSAVKNAVTHQGTEQIALGNGSAEGSSIALIILCVLLLGYHVHRKQKKLATGNLRA